jgi:DNA-binding transcriptional LysR family regulator
MPFESVDSLLRLGVAETIVQLWLPAFVSELYQTYPNIKIEITVDLSRNLEQQLIARSLDLAILMGPISDFSIDNTVLPPVDLTWFCAPGRQDSDLNSMPILSYSRNSRPYLELRREMTNRYGNDFKIFSSISVTAGLELVASGMGVGIFPRQLGMNLVAEGRIVEFDPGWVLDPLIFTASHLGDPRSELCAQAAALAVKVARKSNRK